MEGDKENDSLYLGIRPAAQDDSSVGSSYPG